MRKNHAENPENSFIRYILSDQVWWNNLKQFLSYYKNYICKFTQVNSWHHKLFHFHLSFWTWEVWKGREKITKIWISWERKELFRWNKKHFSKFVKGYHLVKKNKNSIKNSRHKLWTWWKFFVGAPLSINTKANSEHFQ